MSAFGPYGANYTTTRPANDAEPTTSDTWFKNCTNASAKDGTVPTASFMNVLVANLRELVRGAGITLDNTNDNMVLQAVQALFNAVVPKYQTLTAFPASPSIGDQVFRSDLGILFERINDGTSDIWLQIS